MKSIRYHPLIDCDSEGREKVPMFFSDNEETVRESHKLYLMETIPRYYRLCSVRKLSEAVAKTYNIHCPCCGNTMRQITNALDTHRLGVYCCPRCTNNN